MKTFVHLRLMTACALVAGVLTGCAGLAPAGSSSAWEIAPGSQPLTFSSPLDIELIVGEQSVSGEIAPTSAGHALASKLPLTLTFEDRFDHAKTAALPAAIDAEQSLTVQDYQTGDIAYWPDGKQIAVIFGPGGTAVPDGGLIPLGKITAELDAIATGSATEITIRIAG
jgi:hypothetical protein